MNIMQRVICISVVSLCFVPLASPKKITVQLFKTNQGTWGRDFSYALEKQTVEKSMKLPWKAQTIDVVTTLPSYKPIRKMAKISFDDADSAHILHVCPKNNGKGDCHTLNLADHNINNVIGIGKKGKPTSMSVEKKDDLIRKSAFPALIPVAVFKRDKDGKKTTIRAIKSDEGEPDRNVVYSEITITKDTRGPFTKKLQVPLDKEFFIVVDDGRSQKLSGIQPETILNIEKDKTVTIHGVVEQAEREAEEAALIAQKLAKEEEHKAQVARAKAEKAAKQEQAKQEAEEALQEKAQQALQAEQAKIVSILKRQVATRQKLLTKVRSTKTLKNLDEFSQIDALELLINDQRKRGEHDNAARLQGILDNVNLGFDPNAIDKLTERDVNQALQLLLELKATQLEEYELKLREALAQSGARLKIHFPEESGAALVQPTGAQEVHVNPRK